MNNLPLEIRSNRASIAALVTVCLVTAACSAELGDTEDMSAVPGTNGGNGPGTKPGSGGGTRGPDTSGAGAGGMSVGAGGMGVGAGGMGVGAGGMGVGAGGMGVGAGGMTQVHEPAAPVGREFHCDPSVPATPASSMVLRLSANEYANSVRDLFGVDVRSEAQRLPDGLTTSREFNNLSSTVTRQHADQFAAMSRTIASRIEPAKLLAEYAAGCKTYEAACTDPLVANLGSAVLRGPLAAVEKKAFDLVLSTAKTESVPFEEAVRYLVEAMTQAPRFVYRIEREVGDGSVRDVDDFELASRLSFAIWGSTPDATLRKVAAAGQLKDDKNQSEQVARMLADPRAREHALEFFDDWMDLHRTDDSAEVQHRHPDFEEELLVDMRAETRAAFTHIYDNKLPLQSIHNLGFTFITERLAKHYGLSGKPDANGKYDLSAVPERGGLLTQGAMSSLGGAESSTVRRGLHVLGEILCGTIPEPPAGVDTTPTPATAMATIRQSSEVRVTGGVCAGCHSRFEPLVWGLVRYDVASKYSLVDQFNNALPEDGWVVFPDDPEKTHHYKTVKELTELLAKSPRVRDCAALKFQKYVTRRDPVVGDSCSLAAARQKLEQGNGSYQEIVSALALSANIRKISTEPAGGSQ